MNKDDMVQNRLLFKGEHFIRFSSIKLFFKFDLSRGRAAKLEVLEKKTIHYRPTSIFRIFFELFVKSKFKCRHSCNDYKK